MQSSIYISEILTDRMIFLNQITFRRNSLVIRNQIDTVFQSISNIISICGGCRSIVGSFRSGLCSISRSQSVGIFQSVLNICNIFLTLSNIACVGMDFSICFIYPAIGVSKMLFQILCTVNDSLRISLNSFSQCIIDCTLASQSIRNIFLKVANIFLTGSCFIINIILQFRIFCGTGIGFCFICCSTSLLFSKVVFVQLVCNRSDVFVNRINRAYQIVVDLFDDLILRSISTFTFCPFLSNGLITSSCFIRDSFCVSIYTTL